MTGRTEEIRQQMNELLKQAVVQVEGVAGPLTRAVVEKFDLDADKLVSQRNKWLSRISVESVRLAQQDVVTLPKAVKDALGRVHDAIEYLVEDGVQAAPAETETLQAASSAPPEPKAQRAEGQGKPTRKRPRKRTPKVSH